MKNRWTVIEGDPSYIIEEYRKFKKQGFKAKLVMDREHNPYACKYKNPDKSYNFISRAKRMLKERTKTS